MTEIKHPEIEIDMVDFDGNPYAILGRVKKQLSRQKRSDLWEEFREEATSGDYDHLLQTCMKWFTIN